MAVTQLGSRRLVETGAVIAANNDDVHIRIGDLSFRLTFEASDALQNVILDEIGNELHIRLKNFGSALPASWAADVAVSSGRILNLALVVQSIVTDGHTRRIVNYTFTSGEVSG